MSCIQRMLLLLVAKFLLVTQQVQLIEAFSVLQPSNSRATWSQHHRSSQHLIHGSFSGGKVQNRLKSFRLFQSLSSAEEHALEVFQKYGFTTDDDDEKITSSVTSIALSEDLFEILCDLDVEATEEEADVLFRYLDEDEDGLVTFDDFLPWYRQAVDAATAVAQSFQSLLIGRRTIEQFDNTAVSNDILERAVQCAIAAPNRSMSEPWRFIQVGRETITKFAELNAKIRKNMETDDGASSVVDWAKIPGWCVVTTQISPDDPQREQEDFKSVSCAIQNFMLSMWSEGVGTKWTSGPVQKTKEFADLCGVDTSTERVVGCIWYGYATGGTKYADPRRRKKTVADVLSRLP